MFNIKLHNYVRYEKNEYKSLFLTKNNPTDLVNELNKEPYNIDELVKLENRKNERLNQHLTKAHLNKLDKMMDVTSKIIQSYKLLNNINKYSLKKLNTR